VSGPRPPFRGRLRARLEELDVEGHVEQLVGRAGELAHQHREQIDGMLDRASGRLDLSTDGRFADRISRARTSLDRGVDRIEERRPETPPEQDPEGT
jgi:hypothetical protein